MPARHHRRIPARARAGSLLAVLLFLVAGAPAAAAEREYGLCAGLGTLLAPAGPLGASLAFSAAVSPSLGGRRLVRARGELEVFAADGAWAVLPTISGDVGLRLGRLDLFATGGLELFGGARRAGYTVFANLGLLGGAGLAVRLSPRLRMGVRATTTWLPSFAAVKLNAPEGAEQPTYLFLSGMLSLEIVGGEVPDDMDFDE
jgi:hypothetical protein